MSPIPPTDEFFVLPSKTAELEETWQYLCKGVDYIMNKQEIGLSYKGYTNLYTTIYNYCTSTRMQGKINAGPTVGGANLVGADLYKKLNEYFVSHSKDMLEKASTLSNVELLRYYATEWDRYTTGANYLNRLFTYINRFWIKRGRDGGKKDVYPIYTLALVQWKDHFLNNIQKDDNKLTAAALRLIQQQRDGEDIHQGLVKKVVDSFVSLGLDNNDMNKECLDLYKGQFELAFFQATEQYYKKESETFLAENTVSDYLKRVEERLQQEEDRVERYLHAATRKEHVLKCEHVLIREHADLLWESFQNFLDFDRDEDLRRLYTLLSRIPEGLDPMRNHFEKYVKQAGLAAISRLVGEEGAESDTLEPKAYVDALLEVYQKNFDVVNRSFKSEAGFAASLDKACRDFINRNAATGTSSTKSPELMAKQADLLLRKNNKIAEENDLENALNRVMILFKYLEDKDVFKKFYSTKLSKRLIHRVSASEESEATMISKLKDACGFEYTTKLQRMFTDVRLSKDLTNAFKDRMAKNHDDMDITFSIMVLGTNFWPVNPPHDFVMPPEILPTYTRFCKYYESQHSGRKLTWLWNYSKNELRTNYLNQRYILLTSAYQMAVLLQYNKNDTLSFEELFTATAIAREILKQVLVLLVKAKILINEETDQYDLNPGRAAYISLLDFKSKKIRVNLNLPIKAEVKAESTEILKNVDEERKYVIQATIVRIMKSRKTLKNQDLMHEVISQLSQRFTPKIPDIKKAIEVLLEKEYIERVKDAKDEWAYVA